MTNQTYNIFITNGRSPDFAGLTAERAAAVVLSNNGSTFDVRRDAAGWRLYSGKNGALAPVASIPPVASETAAEAWRWISRQVMAKCQSWANAPLVIAA